MKPAHFIGVRVAIFATVIFGFLTTAQAQDDSAAEGITISSGANTGASFGVGGIMVTGNRTLRATLPINSSNSYAGGTTVSSGTVMVGGANSFLGTAGASGDDANSGDAGIVKSGGGTLLLNSSNSYAGTTTINSGTLLLGGSGSVNETGTINVASGAGSAPPTLGNTSLNGLIFNSGVLTFQLGNGGDTGDDDTIPLPDGTTISGTGTLQIGLGSIISSGTLTINSGFDLGVISTGGALSLGSYPLVNYSGTISEVTNLSGLTSISGILYPYGGLELEPVGSDSIFLDIEAAPEPSSWVLFAFGLGGLALLYRTRKV